MCDNYTTGSMLPQEFMDTVCPRDTLHLINTRVVAIDGRHNPIEAQKELWYFLDSDGIIPKIATMFSYSPSTA